MSKFVKKRRATFGTAMAAALAASAVMAAPTSALAQTTAARPTTDLTLSVGTGRMVRLDGTMTDLFVANDSIADVQVRSTNQIYIFGKAPGETTVYATNSAGRVVYSANVRVGTNIGSIDELLGVAMPNADIQARPMNGMVLLTGTVADPADIEEAERLVQAFVGDGTRVISRLRTATPLQVMLQVRIAEVSRSLTRNIGVNLQGLGADGSFLFGLATGRQVLDEAGRFLVPEVGNSFVGQITNSSGDGIAGILDANEENGLVTTLAEPMLTALSGETASFLAGGEFPIPVSEGLNGTSVEFKQYGVGLAFTPTVLEGGRISMRVRPEVSELSDAGAVRLNGFTIPSLTTRRAETTVELGSGQSFMIAGLLSNSRNNTIDRVPFLGNLPIIGALFRSTGFRRNETELVIIVTPYLVNPVNGRQIALPTDGFRSADEGQALLLGQEHQSRSGVRRPMPTMAGPQTVTPGLSPAASLAPSTAPVQQAERPAAQPAATASAAPGFSFD